MIDMQLILRVLGPDALTHLHKKYDGAENSEVGRRYELSVVAFEILVRALACLPEGRRRGNPDEVHVRQGARIFVDDVVIERPRIERYIQVKHVQELQWSYRGLDLDFIYMRLLSHHHHVKIYTVLVTADEDEAKKLVRTRPIYRVPNAKVRHMVDHENLPRLFRHLYRLSNIDMDGMGVAAIIRHVESVWFLELHRHATLSAVMLAAHERSRGVVRSLRLPDPDIVRLVNHVNALDDGLHVAADGSTLIVQWVDGQKGSWARSTLSNGKIYSKRSLRATRRARRTSGEYAPASDEPGSRSERAPGYQCDQGRIDKSGDWFGKIDHGSRIG